MVRCLALAIASLLAGCAEPVDVSAAEAATRELRSAAVQFKDIESRYRTTRYVVVICPDTTMGCLRAAVEECPPSECTVRMAHGLYR
jgi:hypothetical protein